MYYKDKQINGDPFDMFMELIEDMLTENNKDQFFNIMIAVCKLLIMLEQNTTKDQDKIDYLTGSAAAFKEEWDKILAEYEKQEVEDDDEGYVKDC